MDLGVLIGGFFGNLAGLFLLYLVGYFSFKGLNYVFHRSGDLGVYDFLYCIACIVQIFWVAASLIGFFF